MMSFRHFAGSLPRLSSCSLPEPETDLTVHRVHCAQNPERMISPAKGDFVLLFTRSRIDLRDRSGLTAEQLSDFLIGCIGGPRDA